MKKRLKTLLDWLLFNQPWLIWLLLDNALLRKLFLKKYLSNRPSIFEKYYRWKPVLFPIKTVVVIKTDAIGDYVIFRACFDALRKAPKYRHHQFLLIGNEMWKDLATQYHNDGQVKFLFLNKTLFKNPADALYRINTLLSVNEKSYNTLIYWTFSRETICGDWIAQHIPAKHKIAINGDLQCQKAPERESGNKVFNKLISQEPPTTFEPLRNKWLASILAEEELQIDTLKHIEKAPSPYVVLMPGASAAFRQWPATFFAAVCEHICTTMKLHIVLAGAPNEQHIGMEILSRVSNPDLIINKIGLFSLPELENCITKATLLIGNESSGIHIAAQAGVPAICISNGNHYGRFNPYEQFGVPAITTIYPQSIAKLHHEQRLALYYDGSIEDIANISVEEVMAVIQSRLHIGTA